MGRWPPMILFFTVAGGAGFQQMHRCDDSAHHGFAKVTCQGNGMMKAESGAT